MTVLMLRLAGPLQSWGSSSRFERRETESHPTKSGVLGLLAASQGLRRSDPIEHLLQLRFGVRTDQPGVMVTDFHTAHTVGYGKPPTLSRRQYLSDAVFVAGVEGPDPLVESLRESLERPRFPLFLGRRSCPIEGQLVLGIATEPLLTALEQAPWQAASQHRSRQPKSVVLPIHLDADSETLPTDYVHDSPRSFDSADRQYAWRPVATTRTRMANPDGNDELGGLADWMTALES